jgi:hypothetical protein
MGIRILIAEIGFRRAVSMLRLMFSKVWKRKGLDWCLLEGINELALELNVLFVMRVGLEKRLEKSLGDFNTPRSKEDQFILWLALLLRFGFEPPLLRAFE